jgi:hypothetical protein
MEKGAARGTSSGRASAAATSTEKVSMRASKPEGSVGVGGGRVGDGEMARRRVARWRVARWRVVIGVDGLGLRFGRGVGWLWEKRKGGEAMEVSMVGRLQWGAQAGRRVAGSWQDSPREEEEELSRSLYTTAVGATCTEHGTVAVRAVAADVSSSCSEAKRARQRSWPDRTEEVSSATIALCTTSYCSNLHRPLYFNRQDQT